MREQVLSEDPIGPDLSAPVELARLLDQHPLPLGDVDPESREGRPGDRRPAGRGGDGRGVEVDQQRAAGARRAAR
jgi:hypothetical protein